MASNNLLIHFVGGLGGHKGRPLQQFELLAIQLAKQCYPEAKILLHTEPGSWLNAPSYCQLLCYNLAELELDCYGSQQIGHIGEYLSDNLRLHILAEHGGLYIDTDVFCLKPWPIVEQYAKQDKLVFCNFGAGCGIKLNNGILYAGKPNSTFVANWRKAINEYADAPFGRRKRAWDFYSAKLPMKLINSDYAEFASIFEPTNLAQGYGWTSWKRWNNTGKLPNWLDDAYFVHLLGCSHALADSKIGQLGANNKLAKLMTWMEQKAIWQ